MIGKFITWALVLSVAVTLGACGEGANTDGETTTPDGTSTVAPEETTAPATTPAPTTTP